MVYVLEGDFNQQSQIMAKLNIKVTFNSSCKCISQDDKAVNLSFKKMLHKMHHFFLFTSYMYTSYM